MHLTGGVQQIVILDRIYRIDRIRFVGRNPVNPVDYFFYNNNPDR
ncbi:MAG: hypothetical protein OIN83_05140 [Candidatus Methanoperedens sp.]|nr:hypothetical protein [Candidatus Methanoperedens sp.]